jgi:hypothetical protein
MTVTVTSYGKLQERTYVATTESGDTQVVINLPFDTVVHVDISDKQGNLKADGSTVKDLAWSVSGGSLVITEFEGGDTLTVEVKGYL